MQLKFAEVRRTERGLLPPTSSGPSDVIDDLRHGAPRRILTDAFRRFASRLPEGAEVLEVGAAHYDYSAFVPEGRRLTRLDFDPSFKPDIVGDAHDMPIEADRFDAAFAISVLEHVANPYRVTEELFRVLKPGGEVFVWAPFYFAVHGFPGDVSRFTDEGLQICFERAGFEVEHLSSVPYAGLFLYLSNHVHFFFPRRSPRRWMRVANRVLFVLVRLCFPLDRRLKVRTMYAGTEMIARKPPATT